MSSIKDRLIQFVLRGRDELSPEAKKGSAALEGLRDAAAALNQQLDTAKGERGLVRDIQATQRALDQSKRTLAQTEGSVKELREALNANPESAGLQQSLRDAEREASRLRRQVTNLSDTLGDHEKAAKAAGIDTAHLADEERRLAKEVDTAKQALDANTQELRELERQQQRTARATAEHRSRVDAAREAMSSGARQALGFAAAYISIDAAANLVQSGLNKVAAGIRSMLETGDKFELLGKRMASLMGSVEGGERATAWIKEFARDTPLSIEGVTDAFALLKSYGIDPMNGTLQALVDKNEQLGGGMERLQGIASAVGQAFAKEKLQTEEILQLIERGVPVWSMLEKITGKNVERLQDLATKGKMGRDVIAALVTEIGASAKGAAAENMGTLTGLMSNLSDSWTDFLGRIAKSGALDYVKGLLGELATTIEQMDRDGSLDRLAKSLSNAFQQGADKVREFAKELGDVDTKKLADDTSSWLDKLGEKIDAATMRVQLFAAPFRTLFNGLTSGLSALGAAFTGTWGLMLRAVESVADKIPDALGGAKLKSAVASARGVLNSLTDGFVEQIVQDGKDLDAAWDTTSKSVAASAKAQTDAVRSESAAQKKLAQDAAAAFVAEQQRARAAAIDAAVSGQKAIGDMAEALKLIDTATTRMQLDGLRTALLSTYQQGAISQEKYAQATGVLNARVKELGAAAGGTAKLVSNLDEKLGDLHSIQQAITTARTEVDIENIRTALRKLYNDGKITAAQYNEEIKKTTDRQAELKAAADTTARSVIQAAEKQTKSQEMYNQALEDGIVTNEELRRVSGQRLEDERRASGEAMEQQRKQSSEAKSAAEAYGGFIDGTLGRARTPLAQLSAAALALYDRLRGIKTSDMQLDTNGLDATQKSLSRVTEELERLRGSAQNLNNLELTRWAAQTQVDSLQIQESFLGQKAALQSLTEGYSSGAMSAQAFVSRAKSARQAMSLLDDSDLSSLDSAIAAAEDGMKQLGNSTRSTLESLQDELDGLQGRTEDIERRRFAARRRDLEAQQAEAQSKGDSQAIANAGRALGLLRQIEAETAQQRQRDEQEKRVQADAEAAPTQDAAAPATVIRLETPSGKAVDVAVNDKADETRLLSILEEAGLRAL